jgi:thioredoxin reductase (NADPH)
LKRAHKIDNYYGFENGIPGDKLLRNGVQQAEKLGIQIVQEEVIRNIL